MLLFMMTKLSIDKKPLGVEIVQHLPTSELVDFSMKAAGSRRKESRPTILTRELKFGKPISFKILFAGFFNFFEIATVY